MNQIISCDEFVSDDFIINDNIVKQYDWLFIIKNQKLSLKFIEKFLLRENEIYFERYYDDISFYQILPEDFLEKYIDIFYGFNICMYRKLSYEFIEKYGDKLGWVYVSKYQELDEDFIEKHTNKVYMPNIIKYQKLSDTFFDKYQLKKPRNSWLYKNKSFKKRKIKKSGRYELDGDFVIAYKLVRDDYHSLFSFQYLYEIGKTYNTHADYNIKDEFSFGFSAWTYEKVKDLYDLCRLYYKSNKILKIKIHLDDIAYLGKNDFKLRCKRIFIIDEVQ